MINKKNTIVLFFVILCNLSYATNYFVDASNGNDNKTGTSPITAWRSISKINNSSFLPGDSILFLRNEIWREQLIVSSSGEEGNPIT